MTSQDLNIIQPRVLSLTEISNHIATTSTHTQNIFLLVDKAAAVALKLHDDTISDLEASIEGLGATLTNLKLAREQCNNDYTYTKNTISKLLTQES